MRNQVEVIFVGWDNDLYRITVKKGRDYLTIKCSCPSSTPCWHIKSLLAQKYDFVENKEVIPELEQLIDFAKFPLSKEELVEYAELSILKKEVEKFLKENVPTIKEYDNTMSQNKEGSAYRYPVKK